MELPEKRRDIRKDQEELDRISKVESVISELEDQMEYQGKKDYKMYKTLLYSFTKDRKIQSLCEGYFQESRTNQKKRDYLVREYQKQNYEEKRKLEEKLMERREKNEELERERHEGNVY